MMGGGNYYHLSHTGAEIDSVTPRVSGRSCDFHGKAQLVTALSQERTLQLQLRPWGCLQAAVLRSFIK